MRGVAALIAWLSLTCAAYGKCDALILIQPGLAGPQVPWDDYVSPCWILWPLEARPEGHSGLWSLVTGIDWKGEPQDALFHAAQGGGYWADNARSLRSRGLTLARIEFLNGTETYVLAGPQGSVHETSLMLGFSDSEKPVKALGPSDRWPNMGLIIHEASSWDDVAQVARSAGRTLVIEYPPARVRPWTRFWLLGRRSFQGIPESPDLRVPGLIPARSALCMLLAPEIFRWVEDDTVTWGGSHQWLTMGRFHSRPWRTAYSIAVAVLVSIGLVFVLREQRNRIVASLLLLAMLVPAATLLAGNLAHRFGIATLPADWFALLACLFGAAILSKKVLARWLPTVNPLFGPAALSWLAFSVGEPTWSPIGSVFGEPQGFPVMAMAGWFVSMSAACGFARNGGSALRWIIRACTLATVVLSYGCHRWWSFEVVPGAVLPFVALIIGEGTWKGALGIGMCLAGVLATPELLNGVVWKPGGLVSTARDFTRMDGSVLFSFLISPLFVGTLAMVFFFSLVSDRFLIHQYRRLFAEDPRRFTLLTSAWALSLIGIFHTTYLMPALVCAIAFVCVLVYEALLYL